MLSDAVIKSIKRLRRERRNDEVRQFSYMESQNEGSDVKKLYEAVLSVWAVIGALLITGIFYSKYTSPNEIFGFVFAGQVFVGASMILFSLLTIFGHKKNNKGMMYSSLFFALMPNPILIPLLWICNFLYFKEPSPQV